MVLSLSLAPAPSSAQDSSETPVQKIVQLIIHGNRVTKTELIKEYLGLDTGMVYDSLKLLKGEKALESTNLFFKVDVFSLIKSGNRTVYIMLSEKPYLLPGLSGEIYSRKYGKDDPWWRLRGGIEHINFRGRMEVLKTTFSIWDWKGIGLAWQKPLTPTPYYLGLGSNLDFYPDEVRNTEHTSVSGRVLFGRKVLDNSRVSLSILPLLKREISTWITTPDSTETKIITSPDTLVIKEVFNIISWLSDFRDNHFDPSRGLYFYSDIRSNHLHSRNSRPYIQHAAELRLHHPGIFDDNKVVYRFYSILRNRDGGWVHRIQLGGEGTVRGYSRQALGNQFIANNSIMLSMEYRFPIFEFPAMRVPLLADYSDLFSSVRYRIDGALIFDYGRVSNDISEILSIKGRAVQSGTAIGFGLRLMVPTFERSICADFVFGDNPYTEELDFKLPGMPHLYLDLFF